jgi:hypothetical protein
MPGLEHRAYETALRSLDVQERSLTELRSRTGTMLAASSLTASFLGAVTVQQTKHLHTVEVLAIVALAVSLILSVYVLLPKSGFVFSLNAVSLYEDLYEIEDEAEVDRRLAYWLEGYWKANQKKVELLSTLFFVAAIALLMQLLFWTWALAGTL